MSRDLNNVSFDMLPLKPFLHQSILNQDSSKINKIELEQIADTLVAPGSTPGNFHSYQFLIEPIQKLVLMDFHCTANILKLLIQKIFSLTMKSVFCVKIHSIKVDLYHDRFPGFLPALRLTLKLSH